MKSLCLVTDIPDGEAIACRLNDTESVILVRRKLDVFAYLNRCPHAGVELQWDDNRFMSLDGTQLQCSTHGALFNIDNGLCTWGPCQGKRLKSMAVCVENGQVLLESGDY